MTTTQTTTTVLYRKPGNGIGSERPRLLAAALNAAGVPATYKEITRDDFDGDWDDWELGHYCFVSEAAAKAWEAAKPSAPRTTPDEHFAYMVQAVAAAQ